MKSYLTLVPFLIWLIACIISPAVAQQPEVRRAVPVTPDDDQPESVTPEVPRAIPFEDDGLSPGELRIINDGLFDLDSARSDAMRQEAGKLETVQRAIRELKASDDPEIRRSAVMILGKYSFPQAREALFFALDDKSPDVRQSALVGIMEANIALAPDESEKVLELIGDEDVHIRRLASSAIPLMVLTYPISAGGTMGGLGRMTKDYPADIQKILQDAYLDEDTIVRRNLVSNISRLMVPLGDEAISRLTQDSDREVRSKLLSTIGQLRPGDFHRFLEPYVSDADPQIRMQLAQLLDMTSSNSVVLDHLRQLADDPDADVALTAKLALFRHTQDLDLYKDLLAALERPSLSQDQARSVILAATALPRDKAINLMVALIEKGNARYLPEALRIYGVMARANADVDLLMRFTDHSTKAVREVAMDGLTNIPDFPADRLMELIGSKHEDVRQRAVYFIRNVSDEEAEDFLYELLLDEEAEVRQAALREIAQQQIGNWQVVLRRSLQDSDPEIQQTALQLSTLDVSQEMVDALLKYSVSAGNPYLAEAARNQSETIRQRLRSVAPNRQ